MARLNPMHARRLDAVPGVVLVSLAAAMWGLDGLIRRPLSSSTSAFTIVFGEQVVLVALTLPLLVPALRALHRAGPAYVAAGIAVGAGASAIATILFTKALFHGDFITVVVLQKAQPLIAVLGAWLVLKEQPRPGFAWFLLPGLAGVWLIALPYPLDPHLHGMTPIAETLGAASLWAMGTVFGRFLSRRLAFEHVTTVRFAFGFVASALVLPILGAPAFASWHDTLWIAYLALVTGALALSLYYIGLQRTPAMLASIAELAYPVTAVIVGYVAFDATLRWTQWLGVIITVGVISLLPTPRRAALVKTPPVEPQLATASA